MTLSIRAHETRSFPQALVAGGTYRATWTDQFGFPKGRRQPRCTLDLEVRSARGASLSGTVFNSAKNANGLDPDPVTFTVPSDGTVSFRFVEQDGFGDDFALLVEPLDGLPVPPVPVPSTSPPPGLKVYTAPANPTDATATPNGTIVLAGGGTDNDAAMSAMIEAGGRGDVVVLRMDDTGGAYTSYFLGKDPSSKISGASSVRELAFDPLPAGVDPSSSEATIHGNGETTASEITRLRVLADSAWVADTIDHAEILFIAGGNQSKYVDVFQGTALSRAVGRFVQRGGVIGGTSAGMHTLGGIVHTPRGNNGSVTSANALQDPFERASDSRGVPALDLAEGPFAIPALHDIVMDTHFDRGPNKTLVPLTRLGRSVVFLARTLTDQLRDVPAARLVACDQGVAVVLSRDGKGRVFGPADGHDTSAYFLRPDGKADLTCAPAVPLDWHGGVPMVAVPATRGGDNVFDFATWSSARGTASRVVVDNGKLTR